MGRKALSAACAAYVAAFSLGCTFELTHCERMVFRWPTVDEEEGCSGESGDEEGDVDRGGASEQDHSETGSAGDSDNAL